MVKKRVKWLFPISINFIIVLSLRSLSFSAENIKEPSQTLSEPVYLKVANAVASSFDDSPDWAPMPDPMASVDGDLLTRWSPKLGKDNEWISFDFGKVKHVSKIIIRWEQAYAVDYEILASDDAVKWKQIALMKEQNGDIDEIEFSPIAARYIKVVGLRRSNPEWAFSFWEFEMYGPSKLNPDDLPLEKVFPERRDGTKKVSPEKEKPVPSPGKIGLAEFQKGVVYTSWGTDELASVASDVTLERLYKIGVRHIGLMVVWFQNTTSSDIIFADGKDTPKDEAIIHAINKAHSLGIKVVIKPHVDVKTGEYRGDIIPSENWFKSYKDFIMKYAKLAQEYNIEAFSIGTELVNTTIERWLTQWSDLIKSVKGVYNGALSYSANWDEYKDVPFWKEMDFIGIDAYFPLTNANNPTKEELTAAWSKQADTLEKWLKEKKLEGKPIVFSEIGYSSADGTNKEPWRTFSHLPLDRVDEKEQADCIDAMLAVLSKRAWFKGMYWWNYFPKERWAPFGFKLSNKQGEKVLSEWFSRIN